MFVWAKEWAQHGRREEGMGYGADQTEQPRASGTKAKENLSFKALRSFV